MKQIRLVPAKHEAPVCDAYDNEQEVRRFERAVREHRAFSEPFAIVPLASRVDVAYRVMGASGSLHHVDIVDRSGTHDTCSCMDFLANELGTRKHLEAVRRAINHVPALRRGFHALDERPRRPVLTVQGAGAAALHAVGRWSDRELGKLGLVRANGGLGLAASGSSTANRRLAPVDEGGRRVVHAAAAFVERLRRAWLIEGRRQAAASAIATGQLGRDVLSVPLFPYQREGAAHLLRAGRALLADDMGLGKTAQAIAACELLRARGETSQLARCPLPTASTETRGIVLGRRGRTAGRFWVHQGSSPHSVFVGGRT